MDAIQMDPADAAYLSFDSPTTDANVGLLMPLDSPATVTEVRRQVAGGLRRMPELRRRLHTVAMGLDRPWWIDDAEFDVARHVTETAVPAPGDDAAVAAVVAELGARQIDREHPLWEIHVLQIPSSGSRKASTALLSKVHHAIADGFRYREILDAWFGPDSHPAPVEDKHWEPQLPPNDAELLARSAASSSAWMVTQMARSVRQATEAVHTWPSMSMPNVRSAPQTPFNKAVTSGRSWAGVQLDIAASKAIRSREGVTVGGIFNAVIATALRRWLEQQDALPDTPLVALLPISQREQSLDPDGGANRIGIASCALPSDIADPLERLRAAQHELERAKGAPLMDEATLSSANRFSAPVLGAMVSNLSSALKLQDMMPSTYNLLVSSVAMPPEPLHVGDKTILAQYPMAPIFDGMGVNITAHGYQGHLDVGIAACADMLPDARVLADSVQAAYKQICQL